MPPAQTDSFFDRANSTIANQVDALLVLRAFACFMVVVSHCDLSNRLIVLNQINLSWMLFSRGMVAVWIFFCLSGYLMGKAFYSGRYTYNWQGILNFWRNRAVRIVPLYGFAILILSLFVYPHVLKPENWIVFLRFATFTYHIFVLPFYSDGIIHPFNFNAAIWSISVEVQFYLIVPLIYGILKYRILKYRHFWSAIALILFSIFSVKALIWITFHNEIQSQTYHAFVYWYMALVPNLDVFLIGFLMNPLLKILYQSENQKSKIRAYFSQIPISVYRLIAIVLIVALYLFTAHHLYYQERWGIDLAYASKGIRTTTTFFILQPLTAVVTAFFIFAFEHRQFGIKNQKLSFSAILRNPYRGFEIFGNLSYGVYLWHLPIMDKVKSIVTSSIAIEKFYLQLSITLILSIILSTVTYFAIEIPASRWKLYRN